MRSRGPDVRRLTRRCRRAVMALDLPDPFDVRELCRRVAAGRGRRIVLAPMSLAGIGPCGLWLSTADTDFICYEAGTSPLHQHHIILHELGHVLLEQHTADHLDESQLRQLFPALDPAMVRAAIGRARYCDLAEQEAEVFAHLVQERAWRAESAGPGQDEIARMLRDVPPAFA